MKKIFLGIGVLASLGVVIYVASLFHFDDVHHTNQAHTHPAEGTPVAATQIAENIAGATSKVQEITEVLKSANVGVVENNIQKDEYIKKLSSERKSYMKGLAEADPALFSSLALRSSEKSGLPSAVLNDIETEVTLTGSVDVVHADDFDNPQNSKFRYAFKSDTPSVGGRSTFKLYSAKELHVTSRSRVSVRGFALDEVLAADAAEPNPVEIIAAVPPTGAVGEQYTLVLLVKATPSSPEPITVAQTQNTIFNGQFNNFMKEQSYNKTSFKGDVYGWVTGPTGPCIVESSGNTINTAIATYGIDINKYQRIFLLVADARGGCSYVGKVERTFGGIRKNISILSVGLNDFGAPSSWGSQPFSWTNLDFVLSHEAGHSLGVWHANGWDCGGRTVTDAEDCTHVEYGNGFDTMGSRSYSLHFNGFYKEVLGWLTQDRILNIRTSGNYTLNPLEASTGYAAAKITIPNTNLAPYYLEWRKALGFDAALTGIRSSNTQGLMINKIPNNGRVTPSTATRLLDMSPTGSTWSADIDRTTLNVGMPAYNDRARTGITIGPVTAVASSSISFTVGVVPVPCVKADYDVAFPYTYNDNLPRGAFHGLYVRVTNMDPVSCPSANVTVRADVLPGFEVVQYRSPVPLEPGASILRYIDIKPTTAAAGNHTIKLYIKTVGENRTVVKNIPVKVIEPPSIQSVTPNPTSPGASLTIHGSNFLPTNNAVTFKRGVFDLARIGGLSSSNGTSLTITVPREMYNVARTNLVPTEMGDYQVLVSSTYSTQVETGMTSRDIYSNPANISIDVPRPSLNITSPNGGENLDQNVDTRITWTSANIASTSSRVDLELLDSTDTSIGYIVRNVQASLGTYTWRVASTATLPIVGGNSYKIRVKLASSTTTDTSDSTFTVKPIPPTPQPGITLTLPNGGENLQQSSNPRIYTIQTISWAFTNVLLANYRNATVRIDLVAADGSTVISNVVSSAPASIGVYYWYIRSTPVIPTGTYKIKITTSVTVDGVVRTLSDISDAVFNFTRR